MWELVLDTNGGGLAPGTGVEAPVYQLGIRSFAILRLG
jgi:hypothetical protein